MNHSKYFHSLLETYRADIHDMRHDSEGKDVLYDRLNEKRGILLSLLPMMVEMPELVTPAFHGGFTFKDTNALDALVSRSPGKFPSWKALSKAVTLTPWVAENIPHVLDQEGGSDFMAIAVGVNYLYFNPKAVASDEGDELNENDLDGRAEGPMDSDSYGEDDEMDPEAGDRWLEDQGFDKGGKE